MIKAIIFDCFGVLIRTSFEPYYYKYLKNDKELTEQAKSLEDLLTQSQISFDQFINDVAKLAHIPAFTACSFLEHNRQNLELFDFIAELKINYRIGFLSNAAENWLSRLFTEEQIALFDSVVLSYAVNYSKPDKEIYLMSAHELEVQPSECIFVDDIERYCKGALIAGMQSVQFATTAQLKHDLSAILDIK
jgi:HAD superfamily hydrolase (TIGR01509 family)